MSLELSQELAALDINDYDNVIANNRTSSSSSNRHQLTLVQDEAQPSTKLNIR